MASSAATSSGAVRTTIVFTVPRRIGDPHYGVKTRCDDKMTRWGAELSAADKEALLDYLVMHFGPQEP